MWRIFKIVTLLVLLSVNRVYAVDNDSKNLTLWSAGEKVSVEAVEKFGEENCFSVSEINDQIFSRIYGRSFKEGCTTSRDDLRYIKLLHVNCDMEICLGEMICHKSISEDVVEIFKILYKNSYPIERMILIDEYEADDNLSMEANNSSSFNYRVMTGSTKLSKHSLGLAIDINPIQNPYVKQLTNGTVIVEPSEGREFVDRELDNPYMIKYGDLCYREFVKRGFTWGGSWQSLKDYQHFEKSL